MSHITEMSREEALSILKKPLQVHVTDALQKPYVISKEQKNYYAENGFIKLDKVVNDNILSDIRNVIDAAVLIRKEEDKRTLEEKSQYEKSFMQCGYLCWDYPAVKNIVFSKRLAGIARDLMQLDNVRLWHDQALYKEPGGRQTDMHQDTSYWPVNSDKSTTLWLALVDVPKDRGCLYFLPGSQDTVYKEYVDIFRNPHIPDALKNRERIDTPLQAGDATFHSGYTFHGANPNKTDELRKAMTIIYIDENMRFDASDDRNATHTSCQGLSDGDLINTKYTPKLI